MSRDKANKRLQKIQITYNRIEYKELEFCEGDDVSLCLNSAKSPYCRITEQGPLMSAEFVSLSLFHF